MKVWRNSEGREFPACSNNVEICGVVEGCYISPVGMNSLGYELVEKEEPEEFEATASPAVMSFNCGRIESDRLIPGELYSVRKVKR